MKIWHPFTQEKTANKNIKITKGEGTYLFSDEGKKYIDLISSWWVNIHGHSNKEIAEAIYNQAKLLEHVIFAGFTHEPAEQLCKNLKQFVEPLDKFFFSDNGSTCVEVALKMSYQYFKNNGINDRNIYINLDGGYHGDTLGAMSASGKKSCYHSTFSEFFFNTFSIDFPDSNKSEEASLEKLRSFLKENGNKVCALIIEPLVQGAAGMRMYSKKFLNQIIEEVRKYGILVIFDEVMTGFYRTGTMFVMNQIHNKPDILCISKGITGGFLPLSLTITTNEIYGSFLSNDWKKAFIHGHSYTANPIACAAALKSLEILQRPEIIKNIKNIEEIHKTFLEKITFAKNKRCIGTISAFDVNSPEEANKIKEKMLNEGFIIRPINKSIYLIPPYCIHEDDLKHFYSKILIA